MSLKNNEAFNAYLDQNERKLKVVFTGYLIEFFELLVQEKKCKDHGKGSDFL